MSYRRALERAVDDAVGEPIGEPHGMSVRRAQFGALVVSERRAVELSQFSAFGKSECSTVASTVQKTEPPTQPAAQRAADDDPEPLPEPGLFSWIAHVLSAIFAERERLG